MADGRYERIGRKVIREGRVVTDCIDTVSLPDGGTAPWDCITTKGAAAVVAVDTDGKIYLVRQWRDPHEDETLELPAGSRNTAEEPTEVTAARELKEETGCTAGSLRFLVRVRTTPAFSDEVIDIYLAEDLRHGAQHLDPDEELRVLKFSPEELVRMIFDGSIQDGKTIAGILAWVTKKNQADRNQTDQKQMNQDKTDQAKKDEKHPC